MKKIGIFTLYYKNVNYGGVLQAYALTTILNNMKFNSEQVCIQRVFEAKKRKRKFFEYFNLIKIFKKFKILYEDKKESFYNKKYKHYFELRKKSIFDFSESIPHSTNVFNDKNIRECVKDYDIFITGSDQVWGATQFASPYLLNFVPNSKTKISYAASMGCSFIDENNKSIYKKTLSTYDAVSVRESDSVEMLSPLTVKTVHQTLDPTLLLSDVDWNKICSKRIIKEKYLLCYFLGNDNTNRKLAKKYAEKFNLKIVTFSNSANSYKSNDKKFGDYKIYDANPADFISYIKYSECVFTDSFHATVFSGIYKKEYFIFNRDKKKKMTSRIYSLIDLFETEERFCDCKEKRTISYITALKEIDYTKKLSKLEQKQKESIKFLINNLK